MARNIESLVNNALDGCYYYSSDYNYYLDKEIVEGDSSWICLFKKRSDT